MSEIIRVKDKDFSPYIRAERLQARVRELAHQIRKDYEGKEPVFLAVLNGAFMFAADIMKNLEMECEITFVKLSSYEGMSSTGEVSSPIGLEIDIRGRDVIVLEDIIDTGTTMTHFCKFLRTKNPASVELLTLLLKREALQYDLDIKYIGFEIPDKFVVGYGLDYDQTGRNWKDIYQIVGG